MPRPAALLLALLMLAGCARGRPPAAAGRRDPSLAKVADPLSSPAGEAADGDTDAPASSLPSAATEVEATSATTAAAVPAEPVRAPAAAPSSGRVDDRTRAATSMATVTGSIVDPRGDVDALAPAYADVVRVTAVSTSSLRVTVELAGPAPRVLANGEVIGLGVDLFTSGAKESDYQLFADAGSNGWAAYLQTPKGFVRYPGTFEQGDTRVVFEVPWGSIGGRGTIGFSAFLDWSRNGIAVNPSSSDAAPDAGHADLAG